LSATYALRVCPGTINHWIHRDRKWPQLRNIFKEVPSPALSYIIGANKGDGCALTKSGCVKLEVTDRDFAEMFSSKMAELFSREKQNRILLRRFHGERLPLYIVKYSSMQLVKFLHRPIEELLEIALAFPRDFLRGFFDAEGYVSVGIATRFMFSVGAENSNKLLLDGVKQLLDKGLGIHSRINRKCKAGSIKVIRGKAFVMRRTSYSLTIGRFHDINRFANKVNFTISRKAQKLKDALLTVTTFAPRERSAMWERLYVKKDGEWVRFEPHS